MNSVINAIEKMKPFFEKVSRNIYLRAIRDGFFAAMPIVLFSSLFMLIAYVPNIFGFFWSPEIESIIVKPYNYTMGIFAIAVTAMVAKNLTDSINRDMPRNNQINPNSTMLAAISAFMILAVDPIEGGFSSQYMSSAGLLTGFIAAFIVPNIYKVFIKNDITIKLPDEVPPNIAQSFLDVIPFAVNITFFWLFDLIFRNLTGGNFAIAVVEFFQPFFTAAEGYLGMGLIYGAVPLFAFVGIHGSSIVSPAVSAVWYQNMEANLEAYQNGEHASYALTEGVNSFVAGMGGSGATLMITLMFAFISKSKKLKAIGRAASIPVLFGVNEPILFGAPIVLNPVLFIPYVITPIINAWVFKFFVDVLGMNSFMYAIPWTTPAPLGIIMGTGFDILAFVLVLVLVVVDVLVYYPFFRVYDLEQAALEVDSTTEEDTLVAEGKDIDYDDFEEVLDGGKHVLVLCAGAGTSGQLANALNKGSEERNLNLEADAGAYGSHYDNLEYYDLVILAPQVASNYEDIKLDTERVGAKLVTTDGAQYIELTRDSNKALDFVFNILDN